MDLKEQSLTRWASREDWFERTGENLSGFVSDAYAATGEPGQKVKNFLHGTWLGHPLHPVLTDIPIGAWTVAVILDAVAELSGSEQAGKGADAAVAIGLAGAVAAAAAGITDWQATDGQARKVGLLHGLLNTGGALLYGASLVARGRGNRSTGRALSGLGYAAAAFSAWLGGHLVYAEQIGVDHTAGQRFPAEFVPVLADAELAEGEMKRVDAGGSRVLLARRDGRIHAIGEICSHLGGPLAEGRMDDCTVTCPWHGSRFSLEDGGVIDGPGTRPQPALEVRVHDGRIEVRKRG